MPRAALSFLAAITLVSPGFAQPDEGSKVYQSVLKSTVWIISERGGGKAAAGTGTLIDRRRHLILTNYHVIGDIDRATVFFPAYRDDRLIAERDYYKARIRELGKRARVVARDKRHDLALVQLDEVPDGAQALPLAAVGVIPGQSIHSIGNPGASGALWVYTPGKVRQVYHRKWKAEDDGRELTFEAEIVETDSPTNHGDSGGPLVNDKAEMVGVTQGGDFNARNVSTFIDLSEVKTFLGVAEAREVKPPATAAPHRTTPVTVKDEGKFFGDEAIKKANADIADIQHRFGVDCLIETYTEVPDGDAAKVKAMDLKAKQEYYHAWALKRVKAEQAKGTCLLVTRDPKYLYLMVPKGTRTVFDDACEKKLRETLLTKFRDAAYDDGLHDFLAAVRDKMETEKLKP